MSRVVQNYSTVSYIMRSIASIMYVISLKEMFFCSYMQYATFIHTMRDAILKSINVYHYHSWILHCENLKLQHKSALFPSKPDLFHTDNIPDVTICTQVVGSINYQLSIYGGIILFSSKVMLRARTWSLREKISVSQKRWIPRRQRNKSNFYIKLMPILPLRAGAETFQFLHPVCAAGSLHKNLVPDPWTEWDTCSFPHCEPGSGESSSRWQFFVRAIKYASMAGKCTVIWITFTELVLV